MTPRTQRKEDESGLNHHSLVCAALSHGRFILRSKQKKLPNSVRQPFLLKIKNRLLKSIVKS
jgi:hypothetical protein